MMDNWQPIETAPMGKEILRYIPTLPPDIRGYNGLAALIDIGYGALYGYRKATHWMPLPEPPKGA